GVIRSCIFFFQAEDGIRDWSVTGVQTCALPIFSRPTIWRANCDVVTVLRDGAIIGAQPVKGTPAAQLARQMVGREMVTPPREKQDRKSVVEGKRGGSR